MPDFDNYLSPFSWRYGSPAMRQIWSETHKRRLWRRIWVALAQVEAEYGLVSAEQLDNLREHQDQVDIERALNIEASIHHDLMAELQTYAEQAPTGGSILHLGATSTDIEDNADALRIRESLEQVISKLGNLLIDLATRIDEWADLPELAFTHLQPAEPTTLGYRLAFSAQDLLGAWEHLRRLQIRGKGFKGAVGTAAAYTQLVGNITIDTFETRLSELLDLPFFPVTNQTSPRSQEYWVISALAGMAASLHKFAFDLRLLQSPVIGELSEPFRKQQVGSSAMPFKRNPILAEKIDSLCRMLAQMPRVAWDNVALSLLERTLDDSANRRWFLPEAFLVASEILQAIEQIIQGLQVNKQIIQQNLREYGTFSALEPLLMELSRAGADRQVMHSRLRDHAMEAWQAIRRGEPNPLLSLIANDQDLHAFLPGEQLRKIMTSTGYLGIAPSRAREIAAIIRRSVTPSQ